MKFKTTPYHFDLLKDEERLSAFYEAIKELSTSQEWNWLMIWDAEVEFYLFF